MSSALYRKWRPQSWEQVVGQEHVVQTLRNALNQERVGHAYLFAGPRGTGKTTTARLLAKAVNCLAEAVEARPCGECAHCQAVNQGRFLDLIEIDAASNTSVEDVRDLRDKINFTPNQGRYKVYIIDEVHMLSTAAFNALLKTLEEPPPHAIFILATTEVHKIPATVLSRCQRHEFRRIPVKEIAAQLKKIAAAEGIAVDDEALTLIARQSTGALRDAISLLDQLMSSDQAITVDLAHHILGTAASQAVLDIMQALVDGDAAAGLDHIHGALDAGSDPRQLGRQLVDYLRGLLLIQTGNADQIEAPAEVRAHMAHHSQALEGRPLAPIIRVFNTAVSEAGRQSAGGWQPALPLELALIEAVQMVKPAAPATPLAMTPPPLKQVSVSGEQGARASESAAVEMKAEGLPKAGLTDQPGSAAPAASDLTLKLVMERWRQVTSLVRQRNLNTEALLKSGRLLGVKDGAILFGLSEVLKSKIEKDEHREVIQAALQQALQMEVRFQCVATTGKTGSLPPDIESDGMIAAAVRDLGGEIVDFS